jgi:hypothetical protein
MEAAQLGLRCAAREASVREIVGECVGRAIDDAADGGLMVAVRQYCTRYLPNNGSLRGTPGTRT